MAKKSFLSLFKSKEERRAYAIGRKHQYNKEHPLVRYESVAQYTRYNADGTVCETHFGRPFGHPSKRKADASTRSANDSIILKNSNARVMNAVKLKKVNTYDSSDCVTEKWITRKVDKPYRE